MDKILFHTNFSSTTRPLGLVEASRCPSLSVAAAAAPAAAVAADRAAAAAAAPHLKQLLVPEQKGKLRGTGLWPSISWAALQQLQREQLHRPAPAAPLNPAVHAAVAAGFRLIDTLL